MTELWAHTACELARLVRAREVSAREVVQAHLDRIGQVNPALNAVTVVLADSALRAAACCGVAALKPSLGRVPLGGDQPFAFQLMAVHGPIARRVADLRLLPDHDRLGPDGRAAAARGNGRAGRLRPLLGAVRACLDGGRGRRRVRPDDGTAAIARAWHDWMRQAPLILAPVCTQRAFETGADLDPGWGAGWPSVLRMTVAVNLLGLPAVTVPVGCEDGLPRAVQIIGPRFREDLCLTAAAATEAGTGPLTRVRHDPRRTRW